MLRKGGFVTASVGIVKRYTASFACFPVSNPDERAFQG